MSKILTAFIISLGVICTINANAQTSEVIELSPIQARFSGTLESRGVDYIVISGKQYSLAPGLVFYDFNNSFIPMYNAPVKWKKINYSLDLMGQIHKIWLLPEN